MPNRIDRPAPWEQPPEPEPLSLFEEPEAFIEHRDLKLQLAIEFEFLPSWNDQPGDVFPKMSFIETWRRRGRKAIAKWAQLAGLQLEAYLHYPRATKSTPHPRPIERERLVRVFLDRPVKIVVRVWRPDAKVYDVHNVCLKYVLDGFVDARLLYGDDVKWIPSVELSYEGTDSSLGLTAEEKAVRKRIQETRVAAGKNRKRFPNRARFRLEFFYL